ncbi:head decoration protein [Salmonella enterica]|nr:head decoration protein [Salmonella enterica]EHI9909928.1 head decoration protein [Salmonella enterica]EHJ0910797.1 head decoration protein [Salmonella enterica]
MSVHYPQLIAGTQELTSTLVYLSGTEAIPAFTPLMMNADGAMVPWDGVESGKAIYLTPHAIDPTKQPRAMVYKTGIFNIELIHWPDAVATEQKKIAAFAGSGISVQPLANS